MIYLASPYSHDDPAIREQRFQAVYRVAAEMMRDGELIFSSIAHTHPIAQHGLPLGWEYWARLDCWYLERCDEVVVLTLDGWRESAGLQAEIRIAAKLGKPVRYLDRSDILGGQ